MDFLLSGTMVQRIAHTPTDRQKAPLKALGLFALMGFWLFSGIVGRDPWKPDEPTYVGILHALSTGSGEGFWRAQVVDVAMPGELIFVHWLSLPLVWLTSTALPWLQLHEAARLVSVLWTALGIAAIAFSCRIWSGGHISYLAAILAIGCLGLYDRAHSYLPEIVLFAAVALAIHATAWLPDRAGWASLLLALAMLLAAMARGALGLLLILAPILVLMFAPVISAYRAALLRALIFAAVLVGVLAWGLSQANPQAWADYLNEGAGLQWGRSSRFAPWFYLTTLLWFAWPVWPVAIWLLSLRGRGFYGGWQRAEVVVPTVFAASGLSVLMLASEGRTALLLAILPPLIILAAFGVDTLKRTWYALIDWFGILVLGLTALAAVVVSSAIYLQWPPFIAQWMSRYVPGYTAPMPWGGYGVALLAFLIWIVLIHPAQQHSRRAFINWAGCVTFLWIVVQALLLAPADYISSYRQSFQKLVELVPPQACIEALDWPPGALAMLAYHTQADVRTLPAGKPATCPYVIVLRSKDRSPASADPAWMKLGEITRPGDNSERFTLYRTGVES